MSCQKFKSFFGNYVTMHPLLGATYCIKGYLLILFVRPVYLTLRIMNIFLHFVCLPPECGNWPQNMVGHANPLSLCYSTPFMMHCMRGTCNVGLPFLGLPCSFGIYGKVAILSPSRMLCRIPCTPLFELNVIGWNGNDIALHFFPSIVELSSTTSSSPYPPH